MQPDRETWAKLMGCKCQRTQFWRAITFAGANSAPLKPLAIDTAGSIPEARYRTATTEGMSLRRSGLPHGGCFLQECSADRKVLARSSNYIRKEDPDPVREMQRTLVVARKACPVPLGPGSASTSGSHAWFCQSCCAVARSMHVRVLQQRPSIANGVVTSAVQINRTSVDALN